jgi:hypothetical protein
MPAGIDANGLGITDLEGLRSYRSVRAIQTRHTSSEAMLNYLRLRQLSQL